MCHGWSLAVNVARPACHVSSLVVVLFGWRHCWAWAVDEQNPLLYACCKWLLDTALPITARVPPPITVRVLATVKKPPPSLSGTPSSLSGTSVVVIRHLSGHCQAPPSSLSGTSLLTVRHLPPCCQAPPSSPSGTSLIAVRYLPRHCQVPPSSPSGTSLIAVKHCPQWVLFVVVSGSLSLLPALLSLLVCRR